MFEHPYFLGILALALFFLVWRSNRYFLRHAYLESLQQAAKAMRWRVVQTLCSALGWLLLVIAAANFCWGLTESKSRQPVHKYVLVNDGSGSMVDSNKPDGVGQRLSTLTKGNKALLSMLDKRSDGSRDLVGAIVFSNDAFVVSYLVDDPKFVGKKLEMINYRWPPLAMGTVIDAALWAGIEMLATNTDTPDDDLDFLRNRMYGKGVDYKRDEVIQKAVDKYLKRTEHSCIIAFTDGEFDNPLGGPKRMSCYKLLHLCKDLGIRVYIISVETVDPLVLRYTHDTGGYAQIFKGFDKSRFEQAYESIVQSQMRDEITVEERVQRSFAKPIALAALTFLMLAAYLRFTTDRSFTEV